jgi:hypothetical protein
MPCRRLPSIASDQLQWLINSSRMKSGKLEEEIATAASRSHVTRITLTVGFNRKLRESSRLR